ncbi:MAG: M56 family metallopeptidase [Planctomycetota bacterium]
MTDLALLWLASSGLGALVLALLAALADALMGPRRPEVAAGLWWASLVRLVLPPSVGSPVGWSVEVEPSTASAFGTSLFAVWAAGALVCGAVAARRALREARAWRRCAARPVGPSTEQLVRRCAASMGLRRTPRVLAVDRGAACVGIVRPWIALPRDLVAAGASREVEVVLLHELAHLARRDGARRLFVLALQCAFWFHPATWLAGRRLSTLAEIECDRAAARATEGGPASCRDALLAQARRWIERDEPVAAPPFTHPRSVLVARLRALDGPVGPRRRLRIVATFVVALGCIGPAVRAVTIPPFDELDGCLRKRYAVYAALAAESEQASRE